MNPLIWAALGAALGWLASLSVVDKSFMSRFETVGATVFGASIGGQLQLTMVSGGLGAGFQPVTLLGAIGGAIAMLVVLAAFRRAVGPVKPVKKKPRPT